MKMKTQQKEVWFVTGSQHLYGPAVLKQVEANSKEIVKAPIAITFKTVLTNSDAIRKVCLEANSTDHCIGLIAWMHTFSPAKMWIAGLNILAKPFVHLHTQFNRDIPFNEIDMDYMNLNQSAHGDREFGFINARMGIDRKVIVGHWKDAEVVGVIDTWLRAALGKLELSTLKVARFGDNMRDVAVTEGNKVSAQIQFGFAVHAYGIGDLVAAVNAAGPKAVNALVEEYRTSYAANPKIFTDAKKKNAIYEAAKIEVGLKSFLDAGGFKAFTTNFEDLHGMVQLPGIAVQRLMHQGYGFGAEGDWKTAALVRVMKVMAEGLKGGTSFMEDYTYHLDPKGMKVLGAHMLEVCSSIAVGKPSLEVHSLGIGGKADPARLVFKAPKGDALCVSLLDMGNRFRLLINKVKVVDTPNLPKLPVARVLWTPQPDLKIAAAAWILAGGAHHTSFTQSLTLDHILDLAEMAGIECLVIDENTNISDFKKEIRLNEVYYYIAKGIR